MFFNPQSFEQYQSTKQASQYAKLQIKKKSQHVEEEVWEQ